MKRTSMHLGVCTFLAALLLAVMLVPGTLTVQAKKKPVISQKSAYMAKGDTLQLKVKYVKASKVKWSTSNKKVAKVSKKGLITAKKTGKATITGKVGKKKYKCKVTVEKKTINRARKLRDYVLKEGKKDEESGLIVLEKDTYDEGSGDSDLWSVAASKENKIMTFRYYHAPEYPYDHYDYTVTINLISGKAAQRKGTAKYHYYNTDEPAEKLYEGNIRTTMEDDDEYPMSITKYGGYGESEEYEFQIEDADPVTHNDENETLNFRIEEAFDALDGWFKTVKGLKKYGISMKAVGFEWR